MRHGGNFGRQGSGGREAAAAAVAIWRLADKVTVQRPDWVGRPPAGVAGPVIASLLRSGVKLSASLLRFFEGFGGSAVQLGDVLRDGRRAVVGVDGREVRSLVGKKFSVMRDSTNQGTKDSK